MRIGTSVPGATTPRSASASTKRPEGIPSISIVPVLQTLGQVCTSSGHTYSPYCRLPTVAETEIILASSDEKVPLKDRSLDMAYSWESSRQWRVQCCRWRTAARIRTCGRSNKDYFARTRGLLADTTPEPAEYLDVPCRRPGCAKPPRCGASPPDRRRLVAEPDCALADEAVEVSNPNVICFAIGCARLY
jgi:hypothetical protein